jgi:hypothetical protein
MKERLLNVAVGAGVMGLLLAAIALVLAAAAGWTPAVVLVWAGFAVLAVAVTHLLGQTVREDLMTIKRWNNHDLKKVIAFADEIIDFDSRLPRGGNQAREGSPLVMDPPSGGRNAT